jgi:hypothetical protein
MRRRGAGLLERSQHFRRVFAAAQHGPADRGEQHRAAEIEGVAHRLRHLAGTGGIGHAGPGQQPRQHARHHRADADEEALHRVAAGALRSRQLVADEGAERLHRHVDRGVEDPQRAGGDPQRRRIGHHEQRQRRQQRAGEEERPPPAQADPGAVGQVAHHRLHQQAGQRCGDPQPRHLVHVRAQGLEDAAGIGVLQGEPELDAQEAEAHVPDLPERQTRFAFHQAVPPSGNHGMRCAAMVGARYARRTAGAYVFMARRLEARDRLRE